MGYSHMTINRKYARTQAVMVHAMHLLRPFLKDGRERDAARTLLDFFDSQGVQLITEADRIAAGLQPRDHNGMTLEELVIIETHLRAVSLNALPQIYVKSGHAAMTVGDDLVVAEPPK